MGLFWSMKPEPGSGRKRLLISDVSKPLVFVLSVYDGFSTWEDLHNKENIPLARTEIRRWYKSAGRTEN